ncbi:hypothetical protein [Mucisphaera sp.]|uniref:hypothetical protein n=1 Tax=Mucisphaera sp. TaxID=2913024 RepID=UPI003D09E8AB
MTTTTATDLFAAALEPLKASGQFAEVTLDGQTLTAKADGPEEDAFYIAAADDQGTITLGWYTKDRWLSESIEADLMHTGDDLSELIEEELVELNIPHRFPNLDHFRDDDKRYVFRATCPTFASPDEFTRTLLAWEAAFRQLGDMEPDED